MRKSLSFAVVGALAIVLAACAPGGGGGGGGPAGPTAPETISGPAWYEAQVYHGAPPVDTGAPEVDEAATADLDLVGSVFTGEFVSANRDNYVELTVSGDDIVHLYTRDLADTDGDEWVVSVVPQVSSESASLRCGGGPALVITAVGNYVQQPTGDYHTYAFDPLIWTICDAAAADYFG